MALVPVNAIGFVNSNFSIVNFLPNNVPEASDVGPTVRIRAGLADKGDHEGNLGGDISDIWAYNGMNTVIGEGKGAHIKEGEDHDFEIFQIPLHHEPVEYIAVSNGNDATCISWISVTKSDECAIWTGDIGANCGETWHFGNQVAGGVANADAHDYVPKCTWLDADHTNDIKSAALKFHTQAYGKNARDTLDRNAVCASTKFINDKGPVTDEPGKRSAADRPLWIRDHLVTSNITQQTAAELCQSDTSYGPDFIGSDGKFCDMGTKQLRSLCSREDADGCVEFSEKEKTVKKRSYLARRSVDLVHKSYKRVTAYHI